MNLDADETRVVYNCVAAVRRGFQPGCVPKWIQQVYERLDTEIRRTMSAHGHQTVGAGAESNVKLIGSSTAAVIIGCSERHITRIATDIGGEKINGTWVFDERTVTEYAEGRHNGRA